LAESLVAVDFFLINCFLPLAEKNTMIVPNKFPGKAELLEQAEQQKQAVNYFNFYLISRITN
jgi:hypothetical protein